MSTKERTAHDSNPMTLLANNSQHYLPILDKFPQGIVAIDLETTGLSPLMDEIIEVAAVKLLPDGTVEKLSSFIRPKKAIPAETTAIHGIKDQDVIDAPVIGDYLPTLLRFIGDLPVIAHNAKFDLGFIIFSLHQTGVQYPKIDVYCSLKMSRFAFRELESHKLGYLCSELDIKLENHHRAYDDAFASLELFNMALNRLSQHESKESLKEAKIFNTQDFEKNNHMDLDENLKILYERVQKQQLIYIKYRGGTFKNSLRPVKPMSLLPMPEGNILYAHCFLTNIYKSFALKKITKVLDMNAQQISDAHKQLEKVKKEV